MQSHQDFIVVALSQTCCLQIPDDENERPLEIQLTWAQTLNATAEQHIEASEGHTCESPDSELALHLDFLLQSLKLLNEELTADPLRPVSYKNLSREEFQKLAANIRYFYSETLQGLERLKTLGIEVKVDDMAEEQLYAYLHDMYQETLLAEYRNNCLSVLWNGSFGWDLYYPAPRLFLVLPANLDTWIDSDPTTHSFRLYFMCENMKLTSKAQEEENEAPEDMLQHVHLSNHSGYDLQQPQEFFRIYGDYVLRVLQMVECGYCDTDHEIPPLNSFKILCGHDTVATGSQLSKDTITSLVAKSIAYLQDLSLPKWIKNPMLSLNQSVMIETYLKIPDSCNGQGNLHRYITALTDLHDKEAIWMCQVHNQRRLHQEALQELQVFVQSHGGHVSMQEATLRVKLCSEEDSDQFCTLLLGTNHIFNISTKINWKPTRSSMENLCQNVAITGTVTLELDGITLDSHPEGPVQHLCCLFSDVFLEGECLQLITLLNYPRSQERRLFFGDFSLQMLNSPVDPTFSWIDLIDIAQKFERSVSKAEKTLGCITAAREFRTALENIGLPSATAFTMASATTEPRKQKQVQWAYKFDLQELAFVDAYTKDMRGLRSVLRSGSLQRLTVHLEKDLSVKNKLFAVLKANTLLQELGFSYYGHDILYYIENIVGLWHAASTSSLTLTDRTRSTQGRIIMQLSQEYGHYFLQSGSANDGQSVDSSVRQQQQQARGLQIVRLECDHIFSQLSDRSSVLLAAFMKKISTALTLMTLDVSRLSRDGLLSVETILRLSNLEYLKVICTPVKPRMSAAVARVLRSVQWSTLKSLTFSGDHIETWVNIWMNAHCNPFILHPTFGGSQLLHLHLQRTGSAPPPKLSHTSALFIHGLVYLNPSMELVLTNLILKEDFC